jgi:hypothetical protein
MIDNSNERARISVAASPPNANVTAPLRIGRCGTLLALLLCAWPITSRAQEVGDAPGIAVGDYHMHIQGPAATSQIRRMKAAHPELFAGISEEIGGERDGAAAVRALDEGGVKEGTLLSEAYVIASPHNAPLPPDLAQLTRRENTFNVRAALASGGRLKAFVSVNPLAPNAIAELRYWRHRPGVGGVKLHLGNSGYDPRSATDVARLASVFCLANRYDLPVAVHVRNAKDFTLADVQTFIDKVLPSIGEDTIQIAHAGGWGGLDQVTLDGLALYADAIERHAPGTEHLFFDLAAVVLDEKTDPKLAAGLVAVMRRIGLERFVLGSDWPALSKPADYYRLLRSQLPLEAREWNILAANEAPYFRQGQTAGPSDPSPGARRHCGSRR